MQSNRSRAAKIMSILNAAYQADGFRHAKDLTEAYNLSETEQPDLVILDEDHMQLSGLPMFLSLLSALAIDWVVITGTSVTDRVPARRQSPLNAFGRYLKHEWTPRAALRNQLAKRPGAPPRMRKSLPSPQSDLKPDVQSDFQPDKPPSISRVLDHPPQDTGQTPTAPAKTIVMGASTGGIEALIEVLSCFPEDAPPTVIVQHINPAFLPGLADRFDRLCAAHVRAAQGNDSLQIGRAHV